MNKLRTLLVALLGLSAVLLSGCGSSRRAIHYYLPKDYTGWFVVYYGIKDAPPLPIKDGAYIAVIPASGRLKTSTAIEYGSAQDKHFRPDESTPIHPVWAKDAKTTVGIWAGVVSGGDYEQIDKEGNKTIRHDNPARVSSFVGTEKQYREADGTHPK